MLCRMSLKRGKWRIGGNYLFSCLLSSLKLPVVWLDFLRKLTKGVVGGGIIFVESWSYGRCYNDSCIRRGLIKRQWACTLARLVLASLGGYSPDHPKTHLCSKASVIFCDCWNNADTGRAIELLAKGRMHKRTLVLRANAKKVFWPTSTAV